MPEDIGRAEAAPPDHNDEPCEGSWRGGTSASDHYRKVLVLYLEVLVLYLERPATQHCAAACSQKGRF